jgi:hypothetical protein
VRGQRRPRKRSCEESAAEEESRAAAKTDMAGEPAPGAAAVVTPEAAAPAAAAPLPGGAIFSELVFRLFDTNQRENKQFLCVNAAQAAGLLAYDLKRAPSTTCPWCAPSGPPTSKGRVG